MKQAKQRVIALDYFRGLCILAVVINHAMIFSMPFAYLVGGGRLWTSAAEILLIISGLTFGIIRSDQIRTNFKQILFKTWRRAAQIYIINFLVVISSLVLALFLTSHAIANHVDGVLPNKSGFGLLWSIVNYSYSIGWASFLRLYAVFLVLAPLALYVLRTRYWLCVPAASVLIYAIRLTKPELFGPYLDFALWQLYFFMGMLLAKFRLPVLRAYYQMKAGFLRTANISILALAAVVLSLSVLLEDSNILYPRVADLAGSGWLPLKLQAAYYHLLSLKPQADSLLMSSRTGILRPLVALVVVFGIYILYQNYKKFILAKTGNFVTSLGRDTLWIFAAQAITIPLIAALPLPRTFAMNLILTSLLVGLMWSLTKRRQAFNYIRAYFAELQTSYNQAKQAYYYKVENDA